MALERAVDDSLRALQVVGSAADKAIVRDELVEDVAQREPLPRVLPDGRMPAGKCVFESSVKIDCFIRGDSRGGSPITCRCAGASTVTV